jgi:hypothetical protein
VPSKLHEAIAEMLRAKPELVLVLLRTVRTDVPAIATATIVGEALSSLVLPEYRPDAVIEIRHGEESEVESVVVFEAQLHRDEGKLWSLPAYQALARARQRVPCDVVIVAPDRSVAAWLRAPIVLGGGSIFRATVIGPEELRAIYSLSTTPAAMLLPPEIGVLHAIASTDEDDAAHVVEVLERLRELPESHAALYYDLIVTALSDAVRRKVEETMSTRYEYQSDFAKKYYGQGREEGRREALCSAIRRVVEKRGMFLTDEHAKELDACTDIATLETWLDRAAVAHETSEVFETK